MRVETNRRQSEWYDGVYRYYDYPTQEIFCDEVRRKLRRCWVAEGRLTDAPRVISL